MEALTVFLQVMDEFRKNLPLQLFFVFVFLGKKNKNSGHVHVSFHANVHLSVGLFEEKTLKTQDLKPIKLKVQSGAQNCQLIVGFQFINSRIINVQID